MLIILDCNLDLRFLIDLDCTSGIPLTYLFINTYLIYQLLHLYLNIIQMNET